MPVAQVDCSRNLGREGRQALMLWVFCKRMSMYHAIAGKGL
jgi:hypothetical protein